MISLIFLISQELNENIHFIEIVFNLDFLVCASYKEPIKPYNFDRIYLKGTSKFNKQ